MASIKRIKASDGTGNASVATVQTLRAPLASTIIVDTVQGIPDEFYASMGTPHTFVDPVTGEDITVISEDTAVDFSGHVDGANLEIDAISPGYTDTNGSAVGDIVIIKPTTEWADNVAETLEAIHEDDGTLKDKIIDSDKISDEARQGWYSPGATLTYVSNDGGKQATYKFTGVNKTDTIQAGMKVKLPRPTAVGTQCADFEVSSSQYASRASGSLSGITFTDDFTVGAWVKIESLGATNEERAIISRWTSGTGGFIFRVDDSIEGGVLTCIIANGATQDEIKTYAGVPVGEWCHVAMGLDFSTDTYTAYINGKAVTAYQFDPHTLSALVQSGDLNVGAWQNVNDFMDGKLKHVFVANKVMSAAEVREAMVSNALESASFAANLKAYYKLEGNFNDSSGNGNNLTANAGVVATTTDSPFSSTEYGVITSATFSTDTTVNIDFGGKVPINENITSPSYSTHNVPYGFPIDTKDQQREQYDRGLPAIPPIQKNNGAFAIQAATVSGLTQQYAQRVDNILYITIGITLAAAVDDIQADLTQINLAAFGVSSVVPWYGAGWSDGGNAITQIIINSSGMIQSSGNEPVGLAIADVIQFSAAIVVDQWL